MAVAFWSGTSLAQEDFSTRLDRLERTVGSQGLLELLQRVEMLQGELRKLRGEIENQAFALEQLRNAQRETYGEIHLRLKSLEGDDLVELVRRAPEATAEPPLPTLTSPSEITIAGSPSEQTIRVDLQSPPEPTAVATSEDLNPVLSRESDAFSDDEAKSPGEQSTDHSTTGDLSPTEGINDSKPSIVPSELAEDSAESEAAYRDAFEMLKAGQYETSIASFEDFLKTYPTSQYADNAQYWLGETYFVMRQFESAIAEYQRLLDAYPESIRRPHAMLKLVYCNHELGLIERATEVLTVLKEFHPNSRAYRLAEERMRHIVASPSP